MRKRIISFVVLVALVLTMLPSDFVKAAELDTKISSGSAIEVDQKQSAVFSEDDTVEAMAVSGPGLSSKRKIIDLSDTLMQCGAFPEFEAEELIAFASDAILDQYLFEHLYSEAEIINIEKFKVDEESAKSTISMIINNHETLFNTMPIMEYDLNDKGQIVNLYPTYGTASTSAYEQEVKKALAKIQPGMTKLDKIIAMHDFLCLNVAYDYENYLKNSIPQESYSAYGAMVKGKAVCNGYALAFNDLMKRIGVSSVKVNSSTMNHAWNIVSLEGNYYHVDTTWDDPSVNVSYKDVPGLARYKYLLLSDSEMKKRDHYNWVSESGSTPACKSTKYDVNFWTETLRPLLYLGGDYVYSDGSRIIKVTSQGESVLYTDTNGWRAGGDYIGLSDLGGKIVFNNQYSIYAMDYDGTNLIELSQPDLGSGRGLIGSFCDKNGKYKIVSAYFEGWSYNDYKAVAYELGPDYKAVTSVVMDKKSLEVEVFEGETVQLKASTTPKNIGATLKWRSDNPSVATVDANGQVTGVFEGETHIIAYYGKKEASSTVTVKVPTFTVTFLGLKDEVICKQEVLKRHDAVDPSIGEEPAAEAIRNPLGYDFKGWDRTFTNIQEDTIVRGVYDVKHYHLHYNINAEEGQLPEGVLSDVEFSIEDTFDLAIPLSKREGYTFAGWYDSLGNKLSHVHAGTMGDINLTARWISPAQAKGLWMEPIDDSNVYYTGQTIKLTEDQLKVYKGEKLLALNKDYNVSYKNNKNAGECTVIIKGKNNYTGQVTTTFTIHKISLAEANVSDIFLKVNGKIQKPVPTVAILAGSKTLKPKAKTDFNVEYYNSEKTQQVEPKEAGYYFVKVVGKDANYTGERWISMTLTDATLVSKLRVVFPKQKEYTGTPISHEGLEVYNGNEKLSEGTHYTVADGENREIGNGSFVITGIAEQGYVGQKSVSFKIAGISMNKVKATLNIASDKFYTGNDQTLNPSEYVLEYIHKDESGQTQVENLINDKDFTVDYQKNDKVGNATIIFRGKGRFDSKTTLKKTFKIKAYDIATDSRHSMNFYTNKDGTEISMSGAPIEFTYVKGGVKPLIGLTDAAATENLTEIKKLDINKDYTVSYQNYTKLGLFSDDKAPTVIIKGKGNYTGIVKLNYTITASDVSTLFLKSNDVLESSKKNKYQTKLVVTDKNGKKLSSKTDYTIKQYKTWSGVILDKKSRPLAGTFITVFIEGKGTYVGKSQSTYRIISSAKDISKATVTVKSSKEYTGEKIYLDYSDIEVKLKNGEVLTSNDYYFDNTSYVNADRKGNAKVTIRGAGNYGGAKTITFKIAPKNMNSME